MFRMNMIMAAFVNFSIMVFQVLSNYQIEQTYALFNHTGTIVVLAIGVVYLLIGALNLRQAKLMYVLAAAKLVYVAAWVGFLVFYFSVFIALFHENLAAFTFFALFGIIDVFYAWLFKKYGKEFAKEG